MAPTDDEKRVTSQAATRENGYVSATAGNNSWWAFDEDSEETPELRWPLSVKVYDRMRRQDPKVSSVLRAVKSPLLSTTWRLDPGAASEEVTRFVSLNLGLPIKGVPDKDQVIQGMRGRGRFSWSEHLRLALLHLDFGHMLFEQVYRYDEVTDRMWLRKLGPRFPSTLAKFNVARDGGLVSVEQYPVGMSGTPPVMAISRLVAHVHEREGADWWGQSLLRSAYMPWLIKTRLIRVDSQAVERNAMGIPVHGAPEVKDSEASPMPTEQRRALEQAHIDAGLDIARDLRGGANSGVSLANGATLKLMGVEGELPDALKRVLYYDDQIGGAVLANVLNLGRQTGSWALGTTFQDIFVSSLDQIGAAFSDTTNHHVVEDLVDVNFGPDEPTPRVVYDDLAGQDQALAYAIKALVDAGVLDPDDALQTYLRTAYKLPAASDPKPDEQEAP